MHNLLLGLKILIAGNTLLFCLFSYGESPIGPYWFDTSDEYIQKQLEKERAKKEKLLTEFKAYSKVYEKILKENYRRLKRNRGRIIGVESILAGPSQERVQSLWGHSLLRFVDDDSDPFNDLTLSFVANVDEPSLSMKKGIFGGYKVLPELMSLRQFMLLYLNGEGRYLERTAFQMPQENVQQMIDIIVDMYEHPEEARNYTFLGLNCARALAGLLGQVGAPPSMALASPAAPKHQNRYFRHRLLSAMPSWRIETLVDPFEEIAKKTGIPLGDMLKGVWSEEMLPHMANWDVTTLARAYKDIPVKRSLRPQVLAMINKKKAQGQRIFWGIERFTEILYQSCQTPECAEQQAQAMLNIWDPIVLRWEAGRLWDGYLHAGLHKKSSFEQITNPITKGHALLLRALAKKIRKKKK